MGPSGRVAMDYWGAVTVAVVETSFWHTQYAVPLFSPSLHYHYRWYCLQYHCRLRWASLPGVVAVGMPRVWTRVGHAGRAAKVPRGTVLGALVVEAVTSFSAHTLHPVSLLAQETWLVLEVVAVAPIQRVGPAGRVQAGVVREAGEAVTSSLSPCQHRAALHGVAEGALSLIPVLQRRWVRAVDRVSRAHWEGRQGVGTFSLLVLQFQHPSREACQWPVYCHCPDGMGCPLLAAGCAVVLDWWRVYWMKGRLLVVLEEGVEAAS